MQTISVQVLDVDFAPSDEEMPLSQTRVNEIREDIIGHIFQLDNEPNSREELEEIICEEITSETGLMVRSFDYQEISVN